MRGDRGASLFLHKVFMKSDVKKLLKRLKLAGFKNGDLVVTAEIHRITDRNWGRRHSNRRSMEVVTVWPECQSCYPQECQHKRIMSAGRSGGQQGIFGLK